MPRQYAGQHVIDTIRYGRACKRAGLVDLQSVAARAELWLPDDVLTHYRER